MLNRCMRPMASIIIWFLASQLNYIEGQSQNAIGAHRAFHRTSFSCSGRPSGYYADVETGCQVYHMCDNLGRQFSYSCPNTTLFQQRMLICDHWYMVNCSKAESDYAANLLIGQRDKPFVNDEENSLRTPRPDLLDRPYAPDYSGESFRNQYNKQLTPSQNQIADTNAEKNINKLAESGYPSGQQRWKIPPPSRTILPPAYEPRTETESSSDANASNGRFTTPLTVKAITAKIPTSERPYPHVKGLEGLSLTTANEPDDLGTSHSTRYNTSADFNSADRRPISKPSRSTNTSRPHPTPRTTSKPTPTTAPVKMPSKIYEPPYLHPIYNQDSATSTLHPPLLSSTATPFTAPEPSTTHTTTTTRSPAPPTTLAGKPFATNNRVPSTSAAPQAFTAASTASTAFQQERKAARTPQPAQGFKSSTVVSSLSSAALPPTTLSQPDGKRQLGIPTSFSRSPNEPARDLLPPYQELVQHDIATTQGPPIYYEWKVPSNGLEPPKLDAPIGVDGREYPDGPVDYDAIRPISSTTPHTTITLKNHEADSSPPVKKSYENNPFLPTTKPPMFQVASTMAARTPVSRSVKDTALQSGAVTPAVTSNAVTAKPLVRPSTTSSNSSELTKLRQDLSVPEFLFPLENLGRTGYFASDTYNSFQLKIPGQRGDNEAELQHWFGENPKCPECHPSYVKPGTCEPCLRR